MATNNNKKKISEFINEKLLSGDKFKIDDTFFVTDAFEDTHITNVVAYNTINSYLGQFDINMDDNRDDYDWDIEEFIGYHDLKATFPLLWQQIWSDKITIDGDLITRIVLQGHGGGAYESKDGFTFDEIAKHVRYEMKVKFEDHTHFRNNGTFYMVDFEKKDNKLTIHVGCDT